MKVLVSMKENAIIIALTFVMVYVTNIVVIRVADRVHLIVQVRVLCRVSVFVPVVAVLVVNYLVVQFVV